MRRSCLTPWASIRQPGRSRDHLNGVPGTGRVPCGQTPSSAARSRIVVRPASESSVPRRCSAFRTWFTVAREVPASLPDPPRRAITTGPAPARAAAGRRADVPRGARAEGGPARRGASRPRPTLNNIAVVNRARERHDEADALVRRAIALLEGSVDPSHPSLVACRANHAAVLQAMQARERARSEGEGSRARPVRRPRASAIRAVATAAEAAIATAAPAASWLSLTRSAAAARAGGAASSARRSRPRSGSPRPPARTAGRLLDREPADVPDDHWKISVVQSPCWSRTSCARAGPSGRL